MFLYKFIAQLWVSFFFVENISLNFLNDLDDDIRFSAFFLCFKSSYKIEIMIFVKAIM